MTTPYRKQAEVPDYTPPIRVIKQLSLWQRFTNLAIAKNLWVWHGSAVSCAAIVSGLFFSWISLWFSPLLWAGIAGIVICTVYNKKLRVYTGKLKSYDPKG